MKSFSFFRVFGFILIAVGAFKLFQVSKSFSQSNLFGGLFLIVVGLALDFFFVWLQRKMKSEEVVRKKYPGQPWMWRSEWRQNYSEPNEYHLNNFTIIFLIVWCLLTCPVSFYVLMTENIAKSPLLLAVLAFPLFGGLGLWGAYKQRKKLSRLQGIQFQFEKIGELGGKLKGAIHFENRALSAALRSQPQDNSYILNLKNIYLYDSGGENSSTVKNVLWKTDQSSKAVEFPPTCAT